MPALRIFFSNFLLYFVFAILLISVGILILESPVYSGSRLFFLPGNSLFAIPILELTAFIPASYGLYAIFQRRSEFGISRLRVAGNFLLGIQKIQNK
jgi:hypothetical protein